MFVDDFRNEHASFRAADVQPYDVFIFLRQSAAPPENFLLQFRFASIRAPQPELSGFRTICRVNCKSTECTQPAFACHCEKFSTSIRYFEVKSPEPNLIFTAWVAFTLGIPAMTIRTFFGFERSTSLSWFDESALTMFRSRTNS